MKIIHAKSPCCGARTHRFGPRRRQCSFCRKTWTIRPRKRGRPARRITTGLVRRVLMEGRSLKDLAGAKRLPMTPQALSYRFRQMLGRFVAKPGWQGLPRGRLILLIDGFWFCFRGRLWTLYLGAVKPIKGNYAFFLNPILSEGQENFQDWNRFIQALPPKTRARIVALVCDNFRGAKRLARQNRWTLQLCHFHLICQLQARRGHRKRRILGTDIRESIYLLIRRALELPNGPELNKVLGRLGTIQKLAPTRRLGMIAREFLRSLPHYRAYQIHSHLGLPTTTNTVESMGRRIRDLMRRLGNLRTPESLHLWATAFIRMRPKMICNGKHFQQNYFV